jgi:hypothetical protein
MRERKSGDHETVLLEKLGNAVHGITRPFACGGSLVPSAPVTLRLEDLKVAFQEPRRGRGGDQALETLLSRCRAAPFGKGSKTLYDRRVREALELKAEGGRFSVLGFDPAGSGVLEEVKERLCPEDWGSLVAELYALNVYAGGGHFLPHKDTPRGDDMLGTLVVCLPSYFYGGRLVIRHGGARKVFNWGAEISRQDEPSRIHWAAFFGDVDHSIEEVVTGRRVTLTYILRRGEGASRPPAPRGTVSERLQAAIEEALGDRRFFARGTTLGFPCSHMYSTQAAFQKSKSGRLTSEAVHRLKGRDCDVAAAAMRAGLAVRLEPYLFESCGGERWRLKRFPSGAEFRALGDQLTPWDIEKAFSVSARSEEDEDLGVTWVLPAPGVEAPLARRGEKTATAEHLHSCEYSATGYFGNEGSEDDFYLYAALHVPIPPWGKAPRKGSKARNKAATRTETKTGTKTETKAGSGRRKGARRKTRA